MDSSSILLCLSNPNAKIENFRIAHEWFKRKTEIFKDLTLETMKDILDSTKLMEKYRNEIIIRQGDVGDSFYVLLSGSASIYINTDFSSNTKEDQLDHGAVVTPTKLNRSARSGNVQKMKLENKKLIKDVDRKVYGEFIGKYTDGSCFGELALIQVENIRNATIVAEEKSHLLVISREIFDKAIRLHAETMYKEKLNFVNGHFLFKNWTSKCRYQVAMSLLKKEIYFGQDIVVQGQSYTGLVLIKKGAAKVIIDLKQHQAQYAVHVAQIEMNMTPKDENKNRSNRENSTKFRREKIEVAIIGKNDIIGDIEFGFNLLTNLLTVTAAEMCEIYILENVHVERMINAKCNLDTYELLQDLAELKINAHYKRWSTFDELPLLKSLLDEINFDIEKQESLTVNIGKQIKKVSLLPIFRSGPLIDFYGPGSVFFRSKLKRQTARLRLNKMNIEDSFQSRNFRSKTFIRDKVIDSQDIPEISSNSRKSVYQSLQKKSTFTDWETSSQHLNDLEERIHSWMLTFKANVKLQNKQNVDKEILRLSRFKNNDLPKEDRFIIKYKRSQNENTEDTDRRNTTETDENDKSPENGKRNIENLTRQYTELEYQKLKEEMKMKEKRLSVFRLKHAI